MQRLRAYVELSRPFTLIAPFVGFWAAGLAAFGAHGLSFERERVAPLVLGAIMAATLNVASNAVNQIFDLKIDAINKPARPLPAGTISCRAAWLFAAVFFALSLWLAWLAHPPEGGRECFLIVLVASLLVYAYSGPPFRTKRWGLLANLTIALPRGLLLPVSGWSAVATVRDGEPWFLGIIFGLFILGAATTKDFSDMEGDRAQGCITIPLRFGVKAAAWMTAPFLVFPFLLFPLGVAMGILRGHAAGLGAAGLFLALYGVYIGYLILRRPEALATESNHVSWKHMYLQMTAAQIGFAVCYLL